MLFALVANRALDPSSKLAAAHWVGRKAWIDGLPWVPLVPDQLHVADGAAVLSSAASRCARTCHQAIPQRNSLKGPQCANRVTMAPGSPSPFPRTLTCRLAPERVTKPVRTCGTQVSAHAARRYAQATPASSAEVPACTAVAVDFLGDLVGDVVSDVVAGKAGKGLRRMLGRRGIAAGSAGCALKIISGSQDGLSQHWRLGAAQFAPGELHFARHGIARPPVTVLGAHQTVGRVSIPPLGNCVIAQLQTPTATLALAMPGGPLALAVQDLTRSG